MTKDNNYNNTLYIPSIDSFKWWIPLDEVDILNSNLLDHIVSIKVNSSTGEVLETKSIQSNSLKIQFNQYHIHFAINNYFGNKSLIVLINSKLLESEYLQGVKMTNIEKIYNKLMSCEVFNISFEDFLNKGKVSDIDIKVDVTLSKDDFKTIIKNLSSVTKPQRKLGYGVNAFTQNNNLGIQWNEREKSSYSHPFLKLYHKGVEALCGKNREFFSEFIDVIQLDDVVRVETNIKSTKELKKNGIETNSLLSLMKASKDQLQQIIETSVNKNLEPRIKVNKPNNIKVDLSPSEAVYLAHLTNMIHNQSLTFERALEFTLEYCSGKQNRFRLKSNLTAIYKQYIETEKFKEVKRKENEFYSVIGWK